jgi:hypothetical protein
MPGFEHVFDDRLNHPPGEPRHTTGGTGCARVADVIVWVNGAFGSDKTTLVDQQPVAGLATAVPAEVSD